MSHFILMSMRSSLINNMGKFTTFFELTQTTVDHLQEADVDHLEYIFKDKLRIAEKLGSGAEYETDIRFALDEFDIDIQSWRAYNKQDKNKTRGVDINVALGRKKKKLDKVLDKETIETIDKLINTGSVKDALTATTDMMIIYSRAPIDVARMSDHGGQFASCHSEPSVGGDGSYFQCAIAEAQNAGAIAYLISMSEYENIDNLQAEEIFMDTARAVSGITPFSRIRLRVIYDGEGESQVVPSLQVYGEYDYEKQFKHDVTKWAQNNVNPKFDWDSELTRKGGSYEDAGVGVEEMMKQIFGKDLRSVQHDADDEYDAEQIRQTLEDETMRVAIEEDLITINNYLRNDFIGGDGLLENFNADTLRFDIIFPNDIMVEGDYEIDDHGTKITKQGFENIHTAATKTEIDEIVYMGHIEETDLTYVTRDIAELILTQAEINGHSIGEYILSDSDDMEDIQRFWQDVYMPVAKDVYDLGDNYTKYLELLSPDAENSNHYEPYADDCIYGIASYNIHKQLVEFAYDRKTQPMYEYVERNDLPIESDAGTPTWYKELSMILMKPSIKMLKESFKEFNEKLVERLEDSYDYQGGSLEGTFEVPKPKTRSQIIQMKFGLPDATDPSASRDPLTYSQKELIKVLHDHDISWYEIQVEMEWVLYEVMEEKMLAFFKGTPMKLESFLNSLK